MDPHTQAREALVCRRPWSRVMGLSTNRLAAGQTGLDRFAAEPVAARKRPPARLRIFLAWPHTRMGPRTDQRTGPVGRMATDVSGDGLPIGLVASRREGHSRVPGSEGRATMKGKAGWKPVEKCPHCTERIQREHLADHVERVHPNRTLDKRTLARVQGVPPREPRPWTRWISIGVAIVVIVSIVASVEWEHPITLTHSKSTEKANPWVTMDISCGGCALPVALPSMR